MGRIEACFAQLREEGRAGLIAYVCAGDPDPAGSLEICRGLVAAGVDILELGVPFSDPLADGPTNQMAAQRALDAGVTQEDVFRLVEAIRRESEIPIVFYTYYNLVFARGEAAYAERAREAGADGILTLDLPPEEAGGMVAACRGAGLRPIFIVAPTTREERLPVICRAAEGFIYYVSREGVTGERSELAPDLGSAVARIRKHTELPVVVGFGISRPEQVREVAGVADGVVVGSSLVRMVEEHRGDPGGAARAVAAKAAWLRTGLVGTGS